MSEKPYRGKRLDNGEWVKGYYVCLCDGYKERESHRIYTGNAVVDCGDYYPGYFKVDPATVGRYTGLKDSNKTDVFEGDIIVARSKFDDWSQRFVVKFGKCGDVGLEKHNAGYIGFYFEEITDQVTILRTDPLYYLKTRKCEVIGNIHDGIMTGIPGELSEHIMSRFGRVD